jgi:hypothetical protein
VKAIVKAAFDPHAFLGSVSEGRSLAEVPEGPGAFAEDDPSRCAVFIEKEQVKVTRLQVTAGKPL